MKTLTLGTMAVTITMAAMAADLEKLDVAILDNAGVPVGMRRSALEMAAGIFHEAGIEIEWELVRKRRAGSDIVIEIRNQTPRLLLPGAMAYTRPYEGTRIVVFWDRIEPKADALHVLAHVIAHELAHIVQGVARHSRTGVMKAGWTAEDFRQMRIKPLEFTPMDVTLLQQGAAARKALAFADRR